MTLFDTHCHLDVLEFAPDRAAVLRRARAVGVAELLLPAVDAAHWPGLLALCEAEAGLYPALGLHPVYLQQHRPTHLAELERLVAERPPTAIGEIGIDLFIDGADLGAQRELFEAQLVIARDAALPVVIHSRKAHDQIHASLRRVRFERGGIMHAFNGSEQQAERFLDMGFLLGFGGTLTYPRAQRIRRLAATLPESALVLETDAPDIPPLAHRGERNTPEYLPEVLAVLAELRGSTPAHLAAVTTDNARRLLFPGQNPNHPVSR